MSNRPLQPTRLVFILLLAAALACNLPGAGGTATPTGAPGVTPEPPGGTGTVTPTPSFGTVGSISGTVWHDQCDPGPDGEPAPSTPPAGCVGEAATGYRANGTREAGEPAIDGVKVTLASPSCATVMAEAFTAPGEPGYAFIGLAPGTYCLVVNPLAEPNVPILIPGGWTAPAAVDGAITTSVTIGAGENKSGVDFGWDYQFAGGAPGATATPTPVGTAVADCNFSADYEADVTVPDDTIMVPGTQFVKTWRVNNVGTCAWGPGLPVGALAFTGGNQLGAPETTPLTSQVEGGGAMDVSVEMTAPDQAGTYRGEFMFLVVEQRLGVGPDGKAPLFVQLIVPEAEADAWRLTYPAGAQTINVQGRVEFPDRHDFLLRALGGQEMTVTIASPDGSANFAVLGVSDGQPLKRVENEDRAWTGTLPSDQDYRLTVAVPGGAAEYVLTITVVG